MINSVDGNRVSRPHLGGGGEYLGPVLRISHGVGKNILVQLCVIAVKQGGR